MRRRAERAIPGAARTGALRGAAGPLAVAGAAALALPAIGTTAWGPLLHHGPAAGGAGHAAHAAPALAAATWLVGWALMVVAMMLPGATPLLRDVGRAVPAARRAGARAFTSAAFLGVWAASGLAVLGAVALTGGTTAAGPVLLAVGLYQLTPAKRRALEHCRAHARLLPPARAGARDPSGDALRAGVAHGMASVACCGPLMAAVALLAMDRPAPMLLAGCAMTVEAATPLGPRVRRPAGAALIAAGLLALAL